MSVFQNNIKRILKKKRNIIIILLIPLIFTVLTVASAKEGGALTVGIADNDKTEFTEMLKDSLNGKAKIVELKDTEVREKVINNTVSYAIVIDKGTTEDIVNGKDVAIKSYSLQNAINAIPIKLNLESFINAARNVGRISAGDEKKFYSGLNYYKTGYFVAEYKGVDSVSVDKGVSIRVMGFLVMSMVFMSAFASTIIIEDKKNKVFARILSTPLTMKSYMLQNILSFMVIAVLQILGMFYIVLKVFNVYLGPSLINMFFLFLIFALVCVALGVAISSISKDIKQSSIWGNLINLPICMLGGCLWSRDFMPDSLINLSNFVPTTWVLKAAEKILNGQSLLSVSNEIGILLLFALALFLLASWKKVDVVK